MNTEDLSAVKTIQPPPTRKEPVAEELHGRTVVDDYRWLEGDNSDGFGFLENLKEQETG